MVQWYKYNILPNTIALIIKTTAMKLSKLKRAEIIIIINIYIYNMNHDKGMTRN